MILVTGASGLIGHALATRLQAEGRNVLGLDQRPPRAGPAFFLRRGRAGRRPPALRRGARARAGGNRPLRRRLRADGGSRQSVPDLRDQHPRHRAGLRAGAAVPPGRVILCSSISAYGHQDVDGVVTEETPMRGRTTYGASKIAGEAILQAYAEEHGVDGLALRFTHVYGPGRETQCFVRTMIEDALAKPGVAPTPRPALPPPVRVRHRRGGRYRPGPRCRIPASPRLQRRPRPSTAASAR